MKQKALLLLPGTVVKSPDGDKGTLKVLQFHAGQMCWLVDFAWGLTWVEIQTIQDYDIV